MIKAILKITQDENTCKCKNSNTELGRPVLIARVNRSRNAEYQVFEDTSINNSFPQEINYSFSSSTRLRIHKKGCPVSPPRRLCLSDR